MKKISMIACACLMSAGPASADVVVDWNGFTMQAIAVGSVRVRPAYSTLPWSTRPCTMPSRPIQGRFEPYCAAIPDASGSPIVAAATAAHDVLVGLFPAQAGTLDTTYDDYLAGLGLAGEPFGVLVGQEAAACILKLRTGDGRFPSNPEEFFGGTAAGEWRPTSFSGTRIPMSMVTPWVAHRHSFHTQGPCTVPCFAAATASDEWRVCQGLQRSESRWSERRQHSHPRTD